MLIFMIAMVGFQLFYNGSFSFSSQVSPEMVVSHLWQGWIKIASNTIVFECIAGMFLAELMVNDKISDSRVIRVLAWGALDLGFALPCRAAVFRHDRRLLAGTDNYGFVHYAELSYKYRKHSRSVIFGRYFLLTVSGSLADDPFYQK
ncbi:hypothetical protein [Pantoea ananatis]|uniref:hypothetical protein n=1 Tax=Pantoea ananas TaxID=553 RepID=UPI0004283374|nr:hypothetical protein [Pantoea ananatis]